MNRFMLSVTVATAALFWATQPFAQATQSYIYYTPPGVAVVQPMTLGQMIASRMENEDEVSEFRDALAQSQLSGYFEPEKGYTVFAVVDDDYNASNGKKPLESYIVNDRIALSIMPGTNDRAKSISGADVRIDRVGNSYFVNDMRVNRVERNPEGIIYIVGGPTSSDVNIGMRN